MQTSLCIRFVLSLFNCFILTTIRNWCDLMLILIRFDNTVSQCFDSSRSLSQDSCWPTDYNYIVYDLLLPDASEINLTQDIVFLLTWLIYMYMYLYKRLNLHVLVYWRLKYQIKAHSQLTSVSKYMYNDFTCILYTVSQSNGKTSTNMYMQSLN